MASKAGAATNYILRLATALGSVIVVIHAWPAGRYGTVVVFAAIAAWFIGGLILREISRDTAPPPASPPTSDPLLTRKNRTLEAIIDHAPIPLLEVQGGEKLNAANLAARRLFKTEALIVRTPPALADAIKRTTPGQRRRVLLPAGDGGERSYALSVSDVLSEEGTVRLVALIDIQAELQAAEAAALRDLMQVLSHEIMNSLVPVTSLAESARDLLDRSGDEGAIARSRRAMDSVARRTGGLLRFVEGYRELSRIPELSLTDVSLSSLLRDAAQLFENRWSKSGVRLVLTIPKADIIARLDAELILRALTAILTNAAEAALKTGDTPTVELAAAMVDLGHPCITVRDNGPGLREEDIENYFRLFFTTKNAGSGIGLSLAKQIVLAHGGEIRSSPNEDLKTGAFFKILL